MKFWDDLLRTRAKDWLYYEFKPGQVPGNVMPKAIEAENAYANIWLKSARVVNVRSGLKRFYGVVHSYISVLPVRQADEVEVNTVVTPKLLKNVDPRNLDRVVPVNHRLLGPIAHSGHDVEIEVGLFSIEEADLVAPYLSILEKMSDVAGVGFLKAAIPFAEPIKDGVNALLNGQGDSILEIGLSRIFQPLKTGFHLVMRVAQEELDPSSLKLEGENWRVVGANGKLVKDYPYMVVEITATEDKYDWAKLPELKRQYDLVKEAIVRGDGAEAKAGQQVFRRLAFTSSDLIHDHAERLSKLVKDEVDKGLGTPEQHAASDVRRVKEFEELALY